MERVGHLRQGVLEHARDLEEAPGSGGAELHDIEDLGGEALVPHDGWGSGGVLPVDESVRGTTSREGTEPVPHA